MIRIRWSYDYCKMFLTLVANENAKSRKSANCISESCGSTSACNAHQLAHRLVTKYLSSSSTLNVNIYKTALYGDEKSSVTIQILWCQFLDSERKTFPNTKTDTETDADHRGFFYSPNS